MKTMTATELKNSPSELFDVLLSDGEVILTRNGKEFPLKLVRDKAAGDTRTGSQKIVDAIDRLATSIPEEKRDEVGRQMNEALEKHREKVRKERQKPPLQD